ncbi:unnamed protein product [Chrysoparadoxa australica]
MATSSLFEEPLLKTDAPLITYSMSSLNSLNSLACAGSECTVNFQAKGTKPPKPTSLAAIRIKVKDEVLSAPEHEETVGEDGHKDDCFYCDNGGDVLMCEGCPEVYHQACLPAGPSKDILLFHGEDEDWYCDRCLQGVMVMVMVTVMATVMAMAMGDGVQVMLWLEDDMGRISAVRQPPNFARSPFSRLAPAHPKAKGGNHGF